MTDHHKRLYSIIVKLDIITQIKLYFFLIIYKKLKCFYIFCRYTIKLLLLIMSRVKLDNKSTLGRKEYKDRMVAAEMIIRNSKEEPNWHNLDKTMLKCVVVALVDEYNRVNNDCASLAKPVKKYTIHQLLSLIDKIWKRLKSSQQDTCPICMEEMTPEVLTITLLCHHKFCTLCFIQASCHSRSGLLEKCPLCRANNRVSVHS